MLFDNPFKTRLPTVDEALVGRDWPIFSGGLHAVLGKPLNNPTPAGLKQIILGLGCFWGAERLLWRLPGVYVTAVGYAGGITQNPTYEEVCSGQTGHTEAVFVVYDPAKMALGKILSTFWQAHDPTQGFDRATTVVLNIDQRFMLWMMPILTLFSKARRIIKKPWRKLVLARSPPRLQKINPFILLRTIISNICIKYQMAIVAFVEQELVQIDAFDAI